jgi:hypothetical protein
VDSTQRAPRASFDQQPLRPVPLPDIFSSLSLSAGVTRAAGVAGGPPPLRISPMGGGPPALRMMGGAGGKPPAAAAAPAGHHQEFLNDPARISEQQDK